MQKVFISHFPKILKTAFEQTDEQIDSNQLGSNGLSNNDGNVAHTKPLQIDPFKTDDPTKGQKREYSW